MDLKELIDMKLHDTILIDSGTKIIRVPGGWIYRFFESHQITMIDSVFVPFNFTDP